MSQTSTERHTLFAEYSLLLNQAKEAIINNGPYLLSFSKGLSKQQKIDKITANIDQYLTSIDPNNNPMQATIRELENKPNPNTTDIQQRKKYHQQFVSAFNNGVKTFQEMTTKLQQLKAGNDVFKAPDSKKHEYRYIIDTETCARLCETDGKTADCPQSFSNKSIELTGNQTDALRIWRNDVTISKLNIKDQRDDIETSHRDGIQLIPPPKYRKGKDAKGKDKLIKQLDQMGGTILEDVTIENIDIVAPKAALQGIFSSDGMCKNLKINQVSIGTAGGHAISLSGVLTGCEISNVTLHQQPNRPVPEVGLYPVRIGGNMADEGMIYIFGFAKGSGYEYGSVAANNIKVHKTGQSQPVTIQPTDHREEMPQQYFKLAFGVRNFNYQKYFDEYTGWTLADFKKNNYQQYQQMKKWIDRRYSEYQSGVRKADFFDGVKTELPKISKEQRDPKQHGVLDALNRAKTALHTEDPKWMNTLIPELQETAIRSFIMKAIAFNNGTVDPLYDLGPEKDGNPLRKAYLQYILEDSHFNNLIPLPDKYKKAKTAETKKAAITPKDSWASDTALKADLQISAEIMDKGEKVKVFLKDTSAFNHGYTFFWRLAGIDNAVVPFGNQPAYEIDTAKLPEPGKQRIQLALRSKTNRSETLSAYVFFSVNASKAAANEAKPVPIKPEGTWSRTQLLKDHLRVTPSQALAKGEKIKFFFEERSKYNDGSYTFRWAVSGHSELGTGKGKSRTVDTGKLDEGEYRQVFTVTDKNGTAYNGSVNFTVLAAQTATGTQDATSTSTKDTVPTPTTKSWGGLANKIMVTPSPVQQGDKATFTIDTRAFNPETSTLSYYWSFNGKTGRGASFEVDTTDLAPGEHKLNVTLYTKAQGETKRTSIPGGALFTVVKKATAPTPPASTDTTAEKPTKIGGDLGQYIRVTEKTIEKGKTITFSLDPAFIEQEGQNAKLTYYWSVPGHKAGRKSSYAIDTTALDKGSHRVQVAMYKTPNGGKRVASNGWGMFEVVASSTTNTKGVINIQIMNQATNSPESSIRYSLISNSDPTWIHQDKTDSNGKINLEDIPVGQYTLKLNEPELGIVTVESNQENQ